MLADLRCLLDAGDGADSGLEASSSPVVVLEEDADVAMLQIPNTTFQSRPQDVRVSALSGVMHTLVALTSLGNVSLYPFSSRALTSWCRPSKSTLPLCVASGCICPAPRSVSGSLLSLTAWCLPLVAHG